MQQDRFFLELNQKGEIESSHDKAIYVHQHQIVRIFVRNRKQGYHPHLIMQKSNKHVEFFIQIRMEFKILSKLTIHEMDNLTLKQIQQHHEVKSFSLDSSGDWKVDVEFAFTGAAYLRLCWFVGQDKPVVLGVENHIIVQPNHVEKLQEITIQTLLPYCLGKFEDYEKQIRSQVNLGYEAFHFPPIQQLGQSPSLYAIADQQKLNTDIFGNHTYEDLKQLFTKFPNIYFFIDTLNLYQIFLIFFYLFKILFYILITLILIKLIVSYQITQHLIQIGQCNQNLRMLHIMLRIHLIQMQQQDQIVLQQNLVINQDKVY